MLSVQLFLVRFSYICSKSECDAFWACSRFFLGFIEKKSVAMLLVYLLFSPIFARPQKSQGLSMGLEIAQQPTLKNSLVWFWYIHSFNGRIFFGRRARFYLRLIEKKSLAMLWRIRQSSQRTLFFFYFFSAFGGTREGEIRASSGLRA
jgi:hypothetical protein